MKAQARMDALSARFEKVHNAARLHPATNAPLPISHPTLTCCQVVEDVKALQEAETARQVTAAEQRRTQPKRSNSKRGGIKAVGGWVDHAAAAREARQKKVAARRAANEAAQRKRFGAGIGAVSGSFGEDVEQQGASREPHLPCYGAFVVFNNEVRQCRVNHSRAAASVHHRSLPYRRAM